MKIAELELNKRKTVRWGTHYDTSGNVIRTVFYEGGPMFESTYSCTKRHLTRKEALAVDGVITKSYNPKLVIIVWDSKDQQVGTLDPNRKWVKALVRMNEGPPSSSEYYDSHDEIDRIDD